jgi:hypothetical protein
MQILLILEQYGVNVVSCNPTRNFYVAVRVSSLRSVFLVRFSVIWWQLREFCKVSVCSEPLLAQIPNLVWLLLMLLRMFDPDLHIYIYIYIHCVCIHTLMSGYAYTGWFEVHTYCVFYVWVFLYSMIVKQIHNSLLMYGYFYTGWL